MPDFAAGVSKLFTCFVSSSSSPVIPTVSSTKRKFVIFRPPIVMVPLFVYCIVYSVAEYYVPVCGRCVHVEHVEAQLSIAMRTVSCALRPTMAASSTGRLCSATSGPHRFAVTVLPRRSTRRPSSSRIVFPLRYRDHA